MKSLQTVLVSMMSLSFFAPVHVHAADPPASGDWPTPKRAPQAPASEAAVPVTADPAPAPDGAAPRASRRKACGKGKKRCARRAPKVDPRLAAAEAEREQLFWLADTMASGGRRDEAAELLKTAARTHNDPLLYLAAAEMKLAVDDPRGRQLDDVVALTQQARQLGEQPVGLRVAPDKLAGLLDHGQELAGYAEQRRTRLRLHRRGRAELITGGTFIAGGMFGIALLSAGAVLSGRADSARAQYGGTDAEYIGALESAGERADAMLATGLVAGLVGMAIGVPLAAVGARDLKQARRGDRERPQFRVAPGIAGVTLVGRF